MPLNRSETGWYGLCSTVIMLIQVLRSAALAIVSLTCFACGASDDPADVELVSGRVERALGEDFQYDGPVELGVGSEAQIALYSNPALGGDGTSTLLAEQRISPAPMPPFEFSIRGASSLVTDQNVSYHVTAVVRQNAAASDEPPLHDLTSESLVRVTPPSRDVTIMVTGLESCDDPNAGGFCSN